MISEKTIKEKPNNKNYSNDNYQLHFAEQRRFDIRTAKASSKVHDNSNSVKRSCIKAMNLMDGLLGLYVMPKKPQ